MKTPTALTDLPLDQFEAFAEAQGERPFVGRNLRRWVWQRGATRFDEMTDLSKRFRTKLESSIKIRRSTVHSRREDGSGTVAYLLELNDGRTIETVHIPEGDRNTVCVSTQVGCAIACVFCASGLNGLRRNLSAGELAEQPMVVQQDLPAGQTVSNVVVMGIGEPTMNMSALTGALERWNSPDGLGLGARRITISTVGFPRRVRELAELEKEFGLAVSLHAADPSLRAQLVPGTKGVDLQEMLAATDEYFRRTKRRVTFEYVLLDGINASPEHARQVAKLLRGRPSLVNLIPVNPVDGLDYRRPTRETVQEFRDTLDQAGIAVTQRKVRGDGIAAACGQLRLREGDEAQTS